VHGPVVEIKEAARADVLDTAKLVVAQFERRAEDA
jgi:hypothetical protein